MIVILMGVSGAGKTSIGRRLAEELGWEFHDADSFHPETNIQKMSSGIPLSDEDRKPWLSSLRQLIESRQRQNQSAVIACSALKKSYRDTLKEQGDKDVVFVYLKASYELIRRRMQDRKGHFMKADLLRDQFEVLEEPEDAHHVDVSKAPKVVVREIRRRLGVTD